MDDCTSDSIALLGYAFGAVDYFGLALSAANHNRVMKFRISTYFQR